MRRLLAIVATLLLAQCATPGQDHRFRVGAEQDAMVFIGIAEATNNTSPVYTMLWRRIDPATGAFLPHSGDTAFEARTDEGGSIRISGTPGEFEYRRVPAGIYALDSVYALIPAGHVNYFAPGIIVGPDRPTFEVRAGEAVYLGIWQVTLNDTTAVTQLWRLDPRDGQTAAHTANQTIGPIVSRDTGSRAVQCTPHRLNTISQRQIC
ncbi:MAG: hypothetical protein HY054_08160 [Proteobacteria bacterium]|nr:hypothetical protein [Pseudomonadota bacterium]